jgi:hypothetical protein
MRLPLYRKRWWLLAVTSAATVVALWAALTRPIPLDQRVGQIGVGMTEAEVEAVLGPPGNHSRYFDIIHTGGGLPDDGWSPEWMWDEGYASIRFGDNGRVRRVHFAPHDRPPLLDRLRTRLRF